MKNISKTFNKLIGFVNGFIAAFLIAGTAYGIKRAIDDEDEEKEKKEE